MARRYKSRLGAALGEDEQTLDGDDLAVPSKQEAHASIRDG